MGPKPSPSQNTQQQQQQQQQQGFVEGTLWIPDTADSRASKKKRLGTSAKKRRHDTHENHSAKVVALRGEMLAALNATEDPLHEASRGILDFLSLAAELSEQELQQFGPPSHTAKPASGGALANYMIDDLAMMDEFTRARLEVEELLDRVFPVFNNRDALFETEVPQNSPIQQLSWEQAVQQAMVRLQRGSSGQGGPPPSSTAASSTTAPQNQQHGHSQQDSTAVIYETREQVQQHQQQQRTHHIADKLQSEVSDKSGRICTPCA